MRILYLLSKFPALSETFVLNEIIELIKAGHKITILAEKAKKGKVHTSVIKYNLLDKVIYVPSYNQRIERVFDVSKKFLLDFFRRPILTTKSFYFLLRTHKTIGQSLDSYAGYRLICDKSFDVIHSVFSSPYKIGQACFLSKMFDKPFTLCFRARDLYLKPNPEKLKKLRIIERASGIVTNSIHNKQYIKNHLKIDKKLEVVHSSIDIALFKSEGAKRRKKNKIFFVGRFMEKKGLIYLIKACDILNKRKTEYECVLVGEGNRKEGYENTVQKLKIPNIKFIGSLTSKEVKKHLEDSTIFVLPCIIAKDGDRDILANVLKEAMAMQIPIITSNICGIEELVENGKSGILVPPKDSKAIADAIEKLLKHPELRNKMGKNGRRKIEKDFNRDIEVKKIEKVFKGIVTDN